MCSSSFHAGTTSGSDLSLAFHAEELAGGLCISSRTSGELLETKDWNTPGHFRTPQEMVYLVTWFHLDSEV